jgi:hypothetical protein
MGKLSKFELNVLRYLDDMVKDTSLKGRTMKELETHMGLSQEESIDIYRLWYYNQKDGVDYSEMEIDRADTPLIKFTHKMSLLIKPERVEYLDNIDEELLEKLYGDWFHWGCSVPSIHWNNYGIELNLSREEWEEHFSGLEEYSLYRYHEAFNPYESYYDEMDGDELNYMSFNDETIEHLKTIALLSGVSDYPGKERQPNEGELNTFLEKYLPTNHYEDIGDTYLNSLSMEVSRSRQDSVREIYNDEVKYEPSGNCTCYEANKCITIKYDELLYFIKDNEMVNFSDLKDIEVQPEINLEDSYYDTWLDDEGSETIISDLNDSIERVIGKITEDGDIDLVKLLIKREKWEKIFKDLGFKTSNSRWISKDGNTWFDDGDVDYKNDKIKIRYKDRVHIIPLENLSDWTLGSVLDLNESVKYGKRLLKESVEDITKISIFDFDGTLMRTPHPEEGKKEWENFYNKDYPHIGWWSKPESLDDAVFNIEPIESTVTDYLKEMGDPNTLVIMLTGRLPHHHDQVLELLMTHNIVFDEYRYKETGDTLGSKLHTIISLLNKYPNVSSIEMWEDREPHATSFEEWGKDNGVSIEVNLVK